MNIGEFSADTWNLEMTKYKSQMFTTFFSANLKRFLVSPFPEFQKKYVFRVFALLNFLYSND